MLEICGLRITLMTPEEQLYRVALDVPISQTYEEPCRPILAFTENLQVAWLSVCSQDTPLSMGSVDWTSLHWINGGIFPWYETLHNICSSSSSMLQLFGPSNPSGFTFVWQTGADTVHSQNNSYASINESTLMTELQKRVTCKHILPTINHLTSQYITWPFCQKTLDYRLFHF